MNRGVFVIPGARIRRGWWVLHTHARPAPVETAESCGTALSVAVMVGLPCAQTPLTAHGNPTTTHHDHQKIPSFQQKPAPTPQRPRPPMCNTNDNHTHQANHTPHNQTRTEGRPNSTRRCTDLGAEYDRTRRHPLMRTARPATAHSRTASSAASAPPAVIDSIDPRADAEPPTPAASAHGPLRRAGAGRPRRRSAVPPRRRDR